MKITELRRQDKETSTKNVAWMGNAAERIFSTKNFIIINSTIVKIVLGKIKNITCFHITSKEFFPQLIKLQGSRRSISALTKFKNNSIDFTVAQKNEAGILVKLSGDLLLSFNDDFDTEPDQYGMRWFIARNIDKNLDDEIRKLKRNLNAKYNIDWFITEPAFLDKKILSNITKEYYYGCLEIWKNYLHKFNEETEIDYNNNINELLVNNIKIKKVLISLDDSYAVEQICKNNNIPFTKDRNLQKFCFEK